MTDRNTRELTLAIRRAFHDRYGTYPHVVIVHLQRTKLDANRDLSNGACGDEAAPTAWREYHEFLTAARGAAPRASGRGWYMDMHGHGHAVPRLELGYLLRGASAWPRALPARAPRRFRKRPRRLRNRLRRRMMRGRERADRTRGR